MKVLSPAAKMNAATFTREWRHLTVEPEVTLDDLLRPGFWAHHATKLGEFDIIDAVAADGSLDVTLRVVKIKPGLVYTRALRVYQREEAQRPPLAATEASAIKQPAPEGYVIDHTPKTRWRVRTKNPVVEVSRNHMSYDEALASAEAHAVEASRSAA